MKIVNFDTARIIPIFFQVFVIFFEKLEEHIIRKIFPKYMDPVTSTGCQKMSLPNAFVFCKNENT